MNNADKQDLTANACLSWKLSHLLANWHFLDGDTTYWPCSPLFRPDAVITWGSKRWSPLSERIARHLNLPLIRVEDGFLRSFGLGVHGKPALSIVIDDLGLHYDPNNESRIEHLLNNADLSTTELRDRAQQGIITMQTQRLSKYNLWQQPDETLSRHLQTPYVLVVDQVADDASVKASGFDAAMASRLISAAQKENPGKTIVIKTHPDVTSGKKKSCLHGHWPDDAIIIDQALDPWSLLKNKPVVYTVSSQLGLEALISGSKVRCFGGPFYAGWGLTEDEMTFSRRKRKLTLEELFAAAYLLYPKYVDPYTGEKTEFENVAEILGDWKRCFSKRKANAVCVGISKWKQPRIRKVLEFGGIQVKFTNNLKKIESLSQRNETEIICWPRKTPKELIAASNQRRIKLTYIEDGFIRSKGLGAELTPPNSLVFDTSGIYFDPTSSSDLEKYLQSGNFDQGLEDRAQRLITLINKTKISKYNVGTHSVKLNIPENSRIILVPGQVEDDASIRLGTENISNNLQLLKHVRETNPDAYIIYKPHPDVETGLRIGIINTEQTQKFADEIAKHISAQSLLEQVDEVHTMTSTLGFEALCQEKKVVTYGRPFYAGWGLTLDKLHFEKRTRKLNLKQLIAGVLIQYPIYFDPITEQLCTPELLIVRLSTDDRKTLSNYARFRRTIMRMSRRISIP